MTARTQLVSTKPADIITYRHGSTLVFVKPETSYEDAITMAIKEFPDLENVARSSIILSVQASMKGTYKSVRISDSAWSTTAMRLNRGEIVDVGVSDRISKDTSVSMPPPRYAEVDSRSVDTKSRHSSGRNRGPCVFQ